MCSESEKRNGICIAPYLNKAWADLCKAYFIEAKWYYSGYTPTFEEYIENAWISIGVPVIFVHTYFSIPNSFTKKDLFCLEEHPNIIRSSGMLLRLANDLASSQQEIKTGDVPKSTECYMKESGATEAEARRHVRSIISTIWKKMNQEVQKSYFSPNLIDILVNIPRIALWFYQAGDRYTVQDIEFETKSGTLNCLFNLFCKWRLEFVQR
ncbi:hypothetical protein RJT34_27155 [Clitoria ternatea]|uniref:Terpene synthase metal-binding domain-containing protein n=1 Tax=Clitoria ternatea TaxID=43366 RepID=A0AAN9I8E7_CLITE